MEGAEWYYVRNGQRFGPIPFEDLRSLSAAGGIGPDDYVWTETMSEWAAAKSVPGLSTNAVGSRGRGPVGGALPKMGPARGGRSRELRRSMPSGILLCVICDLLLAVMAGFMCFLAWRSAEGTNTDPKFAAVNDMVAQNAQLWVLWIIFGSSALLSALLLLCRQVLGLGTQGVVSVAGVVSGILMASQLDREARDPTLLIVTVALMVTSALPLMAFTGTNRRWFQRVAVR